MPANTLVYDCFSGLSGDMHIGAMLDLGVPADYLRAELARMSMADEFELQACTDARLGISGTRATIKLTEPSHHHRHLSDIRRIIDDAAYPPAVADRALDIFGHIAAAEAKVHGTDIESVHFHEVGATDSIADIVAAALCLEYFSPEQVFCSTLELGGGMVRCAHGVMPVPAPATAEILQGVPCRYGGVDQEATTPTGAAILKHAVQQFTVPAGFVIERIGYGVGQKDFAIPNVARVLLGRVDAAPSGFEIEHNREITCNIDDMSPEAFQPMVDRLFAAGAKDVFLTPIIMKKSRPGTKLSLLCGLAEEESLLDILFANSTTIGVRIHDVEKRMLPREQRSLTTPLGEVRVKIIQLPDGARRWKLEHDDVAAIAIAQALSYPRAHDQLTRAVSRQLDEVDGGADV